MGAISISGLSGVLAEGAAGPAEVAAVPVLPEVLLARIEPDPSADGGFVYAGEEGALFGPFRRVLEGDGWTYGWLRLECKAKADKRLADEGYCLIVAESPYYTHWVVGIPFKRPNKDKDRLVLPPASSTEEDVQGWVEGLPVDYWESAKRHTAGIMGRHLSLTFHDAMRGLPVNGSFVLGLCPGDVGGASAKGASPSPLDSIETAIFCSDTIQRRVHQAARGTLELAVEGGRRITVSESVCENRYAVMAMSIRQALAGPADTFESWLGKPVAVLADRLFCNHVLNLNRRKGEAMFRESLPADVLDWQKRGDGFIALDRSYSQD